MCINNICKLLVACIFCTALHSLAYASSDGVFAHECSLKDLERGKVNVCHVPLGNPENRHTICVDDSAAKNPYNGHFPGEHGGDYLGICLPDPTPTPTPPPGKKVLICHLTGDSSLPAIELEVDESAVSAHLEHGDHVGACVFDCAGIPFGQASVDQCGICGGDSSTCKDCAGVPNGSSKVDACGVCDASEENDGESCKGCDGIPNSDKVTDECGVCGGDNSTCKDCAGVPNGTAKLDLCGVCNGNNNTCLDCAGVPNGSAQIDLCGVCNGNNSSCKDCAGVPNGSAKVDLCGVCNGNNSTCLDCAGVPNGTSKLDRCGVCNGDGTSCVDCLGEPNGLAKLDVCGVCNGDGSSCKDCAGTPNGTAKKDVCGVCNGDGTSCVDCAGIPYGPSTVDLCGVCNGANQCVDCAGLPNGGRVLDRCGVCNGPGGKLVKIKINKKKMREYARTVLFKKTLPYYEGAVKCNRSAWEKRAKEQSAKAKVVYHHLIQAINSLITEVRLCPGECKDKINKALLKKINRLSEKLYWFASEAQHGARAACHVTGPGVRGTRPIIDNLNSEGHKCKTKVCSK